MLLTALLASIAQPSPEAQQYLEEAIAIIEEQHYRSDTADWDALRATANAMAADASEPADTYAAIRRVLLELGERHSFLRPAPPASAAATPAAEMEATGTELVMELPRYTLLPGDIGFLQLPGLDTALWGQEAGQRYRAVLQQGVEYLAPRARCGWIVDLRDNEGGNMWPMLAGLDPLLGAEPFGYFHYTDGNRVPWVRGPNGPYPGYSPEEMEPAFVVERSDAPLAVLVAHETTSSGEMVALALQGRDDVRLFGWPTGGFVTANSGFPLSDGATLVLTTSQAGNRTGDIADKFIMPDVVEPKPTAHFAAMEWLGSRCATPTD